MRSALLAVVLGAAVLTSACGSSPTAKDCTPDQNAVATAQAAKTKADADLKAVDDKVAKAKADSTAADAAMNKANADADALQASGATDAESSAKAAEAAAAAAEAISKSTDAVVAL